MLLIGSCRTTRGLLHLLKWSEKMYQWSWRSSLVALFMAGYASLAASPVQGGAMLDWLFGPPTTAGDQVVAYYAPTTTYYPGQSAVAYQAYVAPSPAVTYRVSSPTVTYRTSSYCQTPVTCQAASPAYGTPTVVYQAPQNMGCPAPVACAPQPTSGWGCLGSCFRRGSSSVAVPATTTMSARQSSYRTTWKRVTVTRYRPILSADPVTGCPVTVMKPCTTYSWQPERRRCGFFDRLFGRCDPGPATTACPPDPCMTAQCVVAPGYCGAATPSTVPGVSMPAPATAPYYVPTPAGPLPGASVLPPTIVPSPNLAPPNIPPTGAAPPPGTTGGPEPADTRPSLVPGGSSSGMGAPQPLSSSNRSSGLPRSNAPSMGTMGPAIAGPQPPTPPRTTLSRPIVPLPTFDSRATQPDTPKPTPVPDPDATPTRIEENSSVPQLLDPRDQVASLRATQAWAYTTISWPRTRPAAAGHFSSPANPRHELLDDGGWRSIAQ